MNVVGRAIPLKHNIRVTLVKLAMELGVYLDWLELLNAVDLHRILASLGEEGLSLSAHLGNVGGKVLSVEHTVVVICVNHRSVFCLLFSLDL